MGVLHQKNVCSQQAFISMQQIVAKFEYPGFTRKNPEYP